MEKDTDLRVRINSSLKNSAENILSAERLTHSEAVHILYSQIAFEGRFPLSPGMPTCRSGRHLDVRVIVKWLVDKLTENPKYFDFIHGTRIFEDEKLSKIFDYLTIDANNHGRKLNGRIHKETHPITPSATGLLTNSKEAYYVLTIYESQLKTDALFLYYDQSPVFSPATIQFLGYGAFDKESYFEDLFRVMCRMTS